MIVKGYEIKPRAYLSGADLSETKLPHFQIVPSEGGFRAWKKIDEYVLKLFIPAHAKRTSCLINRKCRASEVETLEIFGPTTSKTVFISSRGGHYSIGKITRADKFCDDIRTDCSHGIHFFMTREEAEEWYD